MESNTYISHIESNFEILAEVVGEFRVKRQNIEQIVPMDFMKIAISKGANVTGRFSDRWINARILAEYVVFAQNGHHDVVLQNLNTPAGYKIQRGQHVPSMN